MSNAKSAVEAAFYAALAGISGARVFQDVPENDMPVAGDGLVVIGDIKSSPLDTKEAGPDRRVDVIVVSQVTAEERAPLLELQDQIEQMLGGKTFTPEGWRLSVTFQDDDAQLAEDGVTYVGTSAFTVLALST